MTRDEALQMFALWTIADDYESFDIVLKSVGDLGAQAGLTVDSCKVHLALSSLVEAGLATIYQLSAGNEFKEHRGMPPMGELQGWRYAFLITAIGIKVLIANPVCDEEGLLRKDWPASDPGRGRGPE